MNHQLNFGKLLQIWQDAAFASAINPIDVMNGKPPSLPAEKQEGVVRNHETVYANADYTGICLAV